MKLWMENIRIFKGIGKSLVYHFGSKTLRNKLSDRLKKNLGSQSSKIFLKKWKITINFFQNNARRRHYMIASNPTRLSMLN